MYIVVLATEPLRRLAECAELDDGLTRVTFEVWRTDVVQRVGGHDGHTIRIIVAEMTSWSLVAVIELMNRTQRHWQGIMSS